MDRRLVRAAALGLIVLSCSWTSWSAQAGAASLPSHETVNTFVALDRLGESGTFSAVYAVSQGSLAGTVEVAQEASPRQRPFTTGPGKWSFLYQSLAGYASQWIEKGNKSMGLPTSRRRHCLDLQRPWPVPTLERFLSRSDPVHPRSGPRRH